MVTTLTRIPATRSEFIQLTWSRRTSGALISDCSSNATPPQGLPSAERLHELRTVRITNDVRLVLVPGMGMRFLGIEWAPLWLPLHRRLETLAALYFAASFLAAGVACTLLLLYMLLHTRLYPIPLLYAAWLYWDRDICERGGRRNEWARRWTLWK
ncbi:hypothetical protein V5799_015594 [Amblyomma americanum]|uniref:Uncharacterized protein n=1 Tax=Amblyomma americanum TaxID=6943 RepID=A0AAQ4F898_AMBAM